MTTKIKWRLANRPTPAEVADLFGRGLLTKDEAREILFSLETEEDRDKASLQEEIKFLRQLVKNLSSNPNQIIQYINKPNSIWEKKPWYGQYYAWADNSSTNTTNALYTSGGGSFTTTSGTGLTSVSMDYTSQPDFTDIKTF